MPHRSQMVKQVLYMQSKVNEAECLIAKLRTEVDEKNIMLREAEPMVKLLLPQRTAKTWLSKYRFQKKINIHPPYSQVVRQ